ncbi:MAG: hypothetical protein K8F92_02480 [Hyphomicrobium sp.]|uniref:hypothetical protein n=1 Tax=Hyphomicrobium sp. TaxID=82 RepID=UPI00132171F2|nr:hypothetical protein [Hyphomicrobium sp.]KAB2942537.1 MAG: hypothetical protein F9K20_05990 [Hyphomicrobium sp.]MBZ0208508.1 hypothetical protein [Hyphomicrobium sp.]
MSPDWLTAISTGVIAAFTIVLAVATISQGWLTRASLRLTRQQFIATHRPRVIVRFVQGPFLEDKHQHAFITFANVGSSPATIVELGADLARRRPNGDWLPGISAAPKPIEPIVLKSGERYVHAVRAQLPYGEAEMFADAAEDIETCVVGAIRYRDDNHIVRETGFCRVRTTTTKRFTVSSDAEQEYQD